VLRGAAFVADAVPQGAFAGAAGASLLGINTLIGLGLFALAGSLGIGWLSKRARRWRRGVLCGGATAWVVAHITRIQRAAGIG